MLEQQIYHRYKTNIGYTREPQSSNSSKRKACECGSTTHKRKSYKDCELNPANSKHAANSKPVYSVQTAEDSNYSDFDELHSDTSLPPSDQEEYSSDEERKEVSDCDCSGRAHKRECPYNPRYLGKTVTLGADITSNHPVASGKEECPVSNRSAAS